MEVFAVRRRDRKERLTCAGYSRDAALTASGNSALVIRGLAKPGLEMGAVLFPPGFVSFAADENGLVEDEFAPGEREGNLKAVPAFETDLRLGVTGHRDDRQTSDLGDGDDAVLDNVARALRAVRRHGQVVSPVRVAGKFEQGLGTTTAAGAADLLDPEPAQDSSEEGTIFAGADQCREFAGMVPVDDHRDGEAIMPEAEDNGPRVLSIRQTRVVAPMAAEGRGHEPFDQIKLRFRGRQKAHKEIGFQVVNRFIQDVAAYGRADAPPKMLGDRDLNAVISPLPRDKRAKNPRSAAPDSPPAGGTAPEGGDGRA
jgi:hypothetical protein